MVQIYHLDPGNPQLDLVLVSEIQELEKIFLRTPVTELKHGAARSTIRRDQAADQLVKLQTFVREALRSGTVQLNLALGAEGYLRVTA